MTTIRADDIIDRQRLRRKLTFWRIAALLIAVIATALTTSAFLGEETFGAKSRPHIAKIKIEGTITENEDLLSRLTLIEKNEHVKGVILAIDSPGGTTAGGEAIYDAVRKIADKKPVVAQVGTLAASAGYMIASASDQIVARKSSIVGSIGVIFQYPNFQGLLDNIGVDMRAIKSTPLKAEPSFFGETPPEAEAMIRNMILDSYDWFKGIVMERRGFTAAQTSALADGSVFTGRQALDNGLIDQLGGEDTARDWLTTEGLDEGLEVFIWAEKKEPAGFLFSSTALRWLLNRLGIERIDDPLSAQLHRRLMLDGLVSVWHGQYD